MDVLLNCIWASLFFVLFFKIWLQVQFDFNDVLYTNRLRWCKAGAQNTLTSVCKKPNRSSEHKTKTTNDQF